MKWTRQRCHVAESTLAAAFFKPSWLSLITSLTPRRPRRVSERRQAVQNGSASDGPTSRPDTSRRPSVLTDANSDYHGNGHDPPDLAHLHVGRIDPQIRPPALDRPIEERLHTLVDLGTQP